MTRRLRTLALLAGAVALAACTALILGRETPSWLDVLELQIWALTAAPSAVDVRVHIDSRPAGATVRIDGKVRGKTPLDTWTTPGQHWLTLQRPDTIDTTELLTVTGDGASANIAVWRRTPEVAPVRPVYPGASLVDATFLDSGELALLVDPHSPQSSRELWSFDPTTDKSARLGSTEPAAVSLAVAATQARSFLMARMCSAW